MKRGPIIHGVLLAVVLLFAYQTWTREDTSERIGKVGEVPIWSASKDAITAITYDTKDRSVQLERRDEGGTAYFWGKDIRTIQKPKPPEPKPPASDGGVSEAAQPTPSEPETETKTREFAIGKQGDELLANLADLRALRDLGRLDDDKRKEYGLAESTDNVIVTIGGKARTLIIGERVPGSAGGRYVLEPESGRAYAVAGAVLNDLLSGEAGLRLRKPHLYEDDEVGKVIVTAGGKTRTLVRITVEEEGKKSKTWADATVPDKPDQTMSNFLQNIAKLNPSEYAPDLDPKSLELLTKIVYQRENGKDLGWLELYEQPPEPEPAPAPAAPSPNPSPAGAPGATPDAAKPADGTPAKPEQPAGATPPADDGHGHADEAKPATPEPAKQAKYYIRSEATRSYAEVSQSIASRIKEDIQQILAE